MTHFPDQLASPGKGQQVAPRQPLPASSALAGISSDPGLPPAPPSPLGFIEKLRWSLQRTDSASSALARPPRALRPRWERHRVGAGGGLAPAARDSRGGGGGHLRGAGTQDSQLPRSDNFHGTLVGSPTSACLASGPVHLQAQHPFPAPCPPSRELDARPSQPSGGGGSLWPHGGPRGPFVWGAHQVHVLEWVGAKRDPAGGVSGGGEKAEEGEEEEKKEVEEEEEEGGGWGEPATVLCLTPGLRDGEEEGGRQRLRALGQAQEAEQGLSPPPPQPPTPPPAASPLPTRTPGAPPGDRHPAGNPSLALPLGSSSTPSRRTPFPLSVSPIPSLP